ncbi:hypothetical protein DM860_006082 [Cuscuta australis]|uniref:RRM domain-containing protein n=1 Tax=Cuscuta australis TaxID=267555 RepID=A0A328DMQ3_9ASTE|nr:hypothetical protein DM860_006082 [Cuscuta australis]
MAKKRKSRAPSRPTADPEPEPVEIQQLQQQLESDLQFEASHQDPEQQAEEELEEEVEDADLDGGEEEEDEREDTQADLLNTDAEAGKENQVAHDVSTGKSNGEEEKAIDTEVFDDEPLDKVLEPFSKEQLKALVQEAVSKHPDFRENVNTWADKDPAHRKIFVHGLGWDTTTETLITVFGKYGEIEDCKAVTDKVSGKSKGYAFILFKHRSSARNALKEPQKKIGSRTTSCQLASTGPVPAPPPTSPPVSEYTQRKIFVSNVAADLDPKKLYEFFSKYGEIEEGPMGLDKNTGKPKGFCLFVYKSIESARKALEEPQKSFEGHTLNCQKAIDGPKQGKGYSHQQQTSYPQHHLQQQYYQHAAKKGKYSGGGGGSANASAGHLMAPAAPSIGINPAMGPAIGQALTALLTSPAAAGLGIGNLLGGLPVNPHGVPPVANNASGYGSQGATSGGYAGHPGVQGGGYQNQPMGQGGVRPQGGAPWRGH